MPLDDRTQETQQDFFGELSDSPKKNERFPQIQKSTKPILLTTSLEQMLLAVIVIILFGCAAFFLGVLRGRSLSGYSVAPRVTVVSAGAAPRRSAPGLPAATAPAVKSAAAPASAAAARPTLAAKPYTIQLASYKNARDAEAQALALRKAGYAATAVPSDKYTILLAGQYANGAEAAKDLTFFRSKFKSCFIRRR